MLYITNNIIQKTDSIFFFAPFQSTIKEFIDITLISIAIFIRHYKAAIFVLFLLFVFTFHNNSYIKVKYLIILVQLLKFKIIH